MTKLSQRAVGQAVQSEWKGFTPAAVTAPPIPLVGAEPRITTKDNSLELKLYSKPDQDDSPTFMLKIPLLDGLESVSQLLDWQEMFEKALVGQGITTGPDMVAMARRLMKGPALNTFNVQMAGKAETVQHCKAALKATLQSFMPKKVLFKQRRYMNRSCRKIKGMPTREWLTRVLDLNLKLVKLGKIMHDPTTGAFNENVVKLPDDQLIDAAYYGLPKDWKSKMALHNFDPMDHTIEELIEFCERLEVAEEELGETKQATAKPKDNKSKHNPQPTKQDPNARPKGEGKRKYCMFHGPSSHDTTQCRDILRMKEQRKSNSFKRPKLSETEGATQSNAGKSGKPFGAKPFNKSQYYKYKADQELNALITKKVHKELMLFNQEHRTTQAHGHRGASPASSEDLGEEAHNVEFHEVDLERFNDLHLDEEEEASV